MYDKKYPKRKNHRLHGFDYSFGYSYHVIINVKKHEHVLSNIIEKNDDKCLCILTPYGKIVEKYLNQIEISYVGVTVESYVIMPNHIHILLSIIENENSDNNISLNRIIGSFKSMVTKDIGKSIWQKSFYDTVIRNEKMFFNVLNYIEGNPVEHLIKEKYKFENAT